MVVGRYIRYEAGFTFLLMAGLLGAATPLRAAISSTNPLDVMVSMLFNPYSVDSATVVVIADIHMSVTGALGLPQTNLDSRLVNLVNGLNPPPAKIVCAGDLTIAGSYFFGALPDTNTCRQELLLAQREFARFTTAPVIAFPGNHETYGSEGDDAVLFNSIFTDTPAYGKFEVMGLKAFYLFGHESGTLDPPQAAWLRGEISQLAPTDRVAVFVHQPPMGGVAVERGIKPVLLQALGNWQVPVTVYAGHAHARGAGTYALRQTQLHQFTVASASPRLSPSPDGWSPTAAGFLIVCIRNGEIAANIFCSLTNATYYPLEPPADAEAPRFLFDNVPHPLLLLEEGEYDRSHYAERCKSDFSHDAGTDTGNWWSYIDRWSVRVPLQDYGGNATHVLVASPSATPDSTNVADTSLRGIQFHFFDDASNLIPARIAWCTNQVAWIPIPPDLQTNQSLRLEATNTHGAEFHLGAWGLASARPDPVLVQPRFTDFHVRTNGARLLRLLATPRVPCCIESSPDFVHWQSNQILPNPSGVIQWQDSSPLGGTNRFYRAFQPLP